uniref:Putative ASCH domain-containing protein n=1 Tax=viral metagenome TaxID=1070528 RepID=A0A6M3LGZ5_9ZZZZ
MKAISLWQPWASAMALGLKRVETRHWYTSYRGPLLIHAAKKRVQWPDIAIEQMPVDYPLPLGAIVCKVYLARCAKINQEIRDTWPEEIEWGDFSDGRVAWFTGNLQAFSKPIPYKGSQGFFNVPESIVREALNGHPPN